MDKHIPGFQLISLLDCGEEEVVEVDNQRIPIPRHLAVYLDGFTLYHGFDCLSGLLVEFLHARISSRHGYLAVDDRHDVFLRGLHYVARSVYRSPVMIYE